MRMKITCLPKIGLVAAAAIFLHYNAHAVPINLGTAANYAILGGSAVTFTTGPIGGDNDVNGNVGVSPGSSITGAGTLDLSAGTINNNNSAAALAQLDATAAYLAAEAATGASTILNQLGGQNLGPGVYDFTTGGTVLLNNGSPLTLSGSGLFVFQVPAALVTGSGSHVVLASDVIPCNVIWQVTSSATLGAGSDFVGTILALAAITLEDNVTVRGRLLAQTELVSLIGDTIINDGCQPGANLDVTDSDHPSHNVPPSQSVPDAGSTLLLLGSALATLSAFRRRFFSPA